MRAVFAHHMSPDLAVPALRQYRGQFIGEGATYAAMTVLAFASEDEEAQREFVAGWTLTLHNLRRGVREPLRPEQVSGLARSGQLELPADGSMAVGTPKQVVEQLHELAAQAQADELVVVTPSLDRARRTGSYVALAEAWAG